MLTTHFYLSVFLCYNLSSFLSFCLSVFPSLYLSVFISFRLYAFPSLCMSVFPSFGLSVCLSLRLTVFVFLFLTLFPSLSPISLSFVLSLNFFNLIPFRKMVTYQQICLIVCLNTYLLNVLSAESTSNSTENETNKKEIRASKGNL